MSEPNRLITRQHIEDYQRDGAVVLRGVFRDWIQLLKKGAKFNIENPSERALIHTDDDHEGRFLEDFCNWERIKEFNDFVLQSPLGEVAAKLMKSETAQFFHDHYLDKEPRTGVATPWHQDMPYYCIEGNKTVSFWIPLESRSVDFSLKCAVGSHRLPKEIRPTSWSTMSSFYGDDSAFMDLPDMESGDFKIKVWEMRPGDAVAFNFKTIHAANPNTAPTQSRTISFRVMGDDVTYLERPGRTSPNYPNIDLKNGDRMREDWFPIIWKKAN